MSKTAKIVLKLSVCVFLNILLKTVILNYSTIWLLTPTLSKKLYYNMSVLCLYLCVCMSVPNIGPYIKTRSSNSHNFTMPDVNKVQGRSSLLSALMTVDVWLVTHTHVRRLQCSNCITSISYGFVVDLVPTIVQQLTRFCLI